MRTLREAADALLAYVPPRRGAPQPSLAATRELLAALGDPQDAVRAAHVAGTSGKTSTAYLLRALVVGAGARPGLTVSPHVTSITERVQVGAGPLPDAVFAARVDRFLALVGATGLRPSFFEVVTALAHWVFAGSGGRDRPVDLAVLETGIGGRNDRTNTVRRADKVCLVADIGYDHTELLGDTVEEIAAHKAGIAQPGNHLLVVEQEERVLKVVEQVATDRGATVTVVPVERFDDLELPPFQRRNLSLALAGYRRLGYPQPSPAGLAAAAQALPPGRMEVRSVDGQQVILDGAHNPQKLAALVDALRARGYRRLPVLASLLRAPEAKLQAALEVLAPVAGELIVPEFTAVAGIGKQTPPAADVAALARQAGIARVSVVPDAWAGLAALLSRPAGPVLVTGSLYLVAEVREALGRRAEEGA